MPQITPTSHYTWPTHKLRDEKNNVFDFNTIKSKWVFTYFYPKAMTPGCTIQSIAMNKLQAEAPAGLLQVIGVSPDAPQFNHKFCVKDGLHIPLLSDTEHHLAMHFGLWVEKSMYGKKYHGMQRATLIFDSTRACVAAFTMSNVNEQVAQTLQFYQDRVLK